MSAILESGLPGVAHDTVSPVLSAATVLVPILNLGVAEGMIDLAATLAAGEVSIGDQAALQPRVVVLGVVEVPGDQPLTSGLDMARSYRALLDFLPNEVEASGMRVRVDRLVRVGRSVSSAVREAAYDEQAGMVLFYWKGHARHPRKNFYGGTIDAALQDALYDLVIVRPEGWRDAKRVLLPVRGGPSAERSLRLALSIAESLKIPITVMHNVPMAPDGVSEPGIGVLGQMAALGEEPYIIFNEHLQIAQESASVPVESILTIGTDPSASLAQEIHESDLVVMGMGADSGVARGGVRPMSITIAKKKSLPMLVLRAAGQVDMETYARESRSVRPKSEGSDMPSERWFVENTYHGDEFRDPEEFLRLKRANGRSLSVGILTSNDEKHIYSILMGLKKVLQELHPIADQIIVVDAGSTDGTLEVARSLGVETYVAGELLPEQGNLYGRGESWWKSLSVLRGDVCVWLDPRARRFHPTTAMSLAWPLLRVPHLQFVKAFETPHPYDPKQDAKERENGDESQQLSASGVNWGETTLRRRESEPGMLAGRIRVQALKPADLNALTASQIAALPPHTILQVLYPAMSGLIEPFSRDIAGRRGAMLDIPAFAGESNVAGLLISVAAQYGTRAIAQVELRNARPALSPQANMHNALELLQVLERRLPDPEARRYAAETVARLQKEMEGKSQGAGFEVRALGPLERPAMRGVKD